MKSKHLHGVVHQNGRLHSTTGRSGGTESVTRVNGVWKPLSFAKNFQVKRDGEGETVNWSLCLGKTSSLQWRKLQLIAFLFARSLLITGMNEIKKRAD